ncbi:winged helix-turn-helix domain-containing protein [Streptomyces sp. HK10]|uniref:winged helix-turn-helix domain-containing protein n=1 Tax=Streptomyces sp. HK10 TaxID=3373255 RepID=UPI00374840D4
MGETLGQPEYRRVRDDLHRKIADGELKVGEPIPSTSKLQEEYGVSVTVVRRAVNELRSEGLLYGQSGKGVFVHAKPDTARGEQATLERLAEGFANLERRVGELETTNADGVAALRAELNEMKKHVASLQAHLIDLYGRTGQPYPHHIQPAATDTHGDQAAGA